MSKTSTLAFYDDSAQGWERALYAFLGEKQRRSGSLRTAEAYSRMIQDFFGRAGKPPDQVAGQEVFAWAHGRGASGREPSAITIGARMACLSSFYRFLIRMSIVTSNPCDALERPRIQASPPRGLSAEEIRRLLQAIPETKGGLRDRAIVLTLALTGRRRTEVIDMKRGDLPEEDGAVYYRYRGKGGKKAKRELPRPAYEAIRTALAAWGKSLGALDGKESLWPTDDAERAAKGLGVTSGTFYGNLQRYLRTAGLPPAGVHILRHSAAKLRRDAGESVEDVSRFLDHSSLAVTTTYLRRLEGQEDRSWRTVAAAIGVVGQSRSDPLSSWEEAQPPLDSRASQRTNLVACRQGERRKRWESCCGPKRRADCKKKTESKCESRVGMSVEENKAVVRCFNEAMKEYWRTGNASVFDELLAPDYVQHWPGFPSDREGYMQMLAMLRAAFPDLQKTTEEMLADGDRVIDRVTVRCTHTGHFRRVPPTGRVVTLTEMHVARLAGGKIVERWGEWDQLGLLQQIGAIQPLA